MTVNCYHCPEEAEWLVFDTDNDHIPLCDRCYHQIETKGYTFIQCGHEAKYMIKATDVALHVECYYSCEECGDNLLYDCREVGITCEVKPL